MSKDIFKRNPNIPEAFITSDNEEFYTKNAAENHAKSLNDKTIKHLTNPSEKVAIVEDSNQLVQTGENPDGSPKLENITAEINVDSLLPVYNEVFAKLLKSINPDEVKAKAEEVLQKGAEAGTDIGNQNSDAAGGNTTNQAPKTEVKLTPKQQAQAEYTAKFGEIPADEFTKNELLEAIEKGKKLVAEIKNS